MRWSRTISMLAFLAVTAVAVAGCGGGAGGVAGEGKVQVAATTSVISDLVEEVGGERVEVFSVVPVGGSPETFQPSPRDAGRISEAEVVFENGLGIDGWVEGLVEGAGGEDQIVVELTEGLEPLEGVEGEAGGDPHMWLDVAYAQRYVAKIRDALVEADPEGAEDYEANAEEYLAELGDLDAYIRETVDGIPEERRKLVTLHDAFRYFAEAYGFELVGVVIENPDAEPSSREIAEVARTIEEEGVPAIFTEPQFSPALADTLAREAGVEVYELYTDTLVDDEAGSSYERMMRTNVDRIAEALG